MIRPAVDGKQFDDARPRTEALPPTLIPPGANPSDVEKANQSLLPDERVPSLAAQGRPALGESALCPPQEGRSGIRSRRPTALRGLRGWIPYDKNWAAGWTRGLLKSDHGDAYTTCLSYEPSRFLVRATVILRCSRPLNDTDRKTLSRIQAASDLTRLNYDDECSVCDVETQSVCPEDKAWEFVAKTVLEDLRRVLSDDRLRSITNK
jgi:hypothetical protein